MRVAVLFILIPAAAIAHPGIGIVKDSKGNIFYTDLTHVWRIDPVGTKSIAVRNVHTHELFMDKEDNLFGEHLWYNGEALDTWGHYVWKLSPSGTFSKIIPDTEGFRKDFSFVHDHMGRMYHAEGPAGCQHVRRVNADNSTTVLGKECLSNIRWMTSSPSGSLYLIDGGNVKRMDPSGSITTLAIDVPTPKRTQFFVNKDHYLGGMAIDKDQNIYVCDFSARSVKMIQKNGEVSIVAEVGIPWAPSGILIDEATGDFWLLESSITNEVRVEKISNRGVRTIY